STKICEAVVKCYKATYKKMPKETLAVVDSLGYCYAPPPDVNLQVSIGGTKQVKGITDYIPKIYDYLVAIVSIVAIVMLMVGGLQYLTAGGNQQAVTKAKERILGAIVGLFLVLGAYTVLNTINPNLTKLSLPPIKMIRADPLTDEKGECPADSPQKTGQKTAGIQCNNICDCRMGESCIEIEKNVAVEILEYMVGGSVSLMSFGVPGAAGVATTGGKYILKGSYAILSKIAKKLTIYVLKNPIKTAAGVGAYMVLKEVGVMGSGGTEIKSVDNGACIEVAQKSVAAGDWCAQNSNCITGKCIDSYTKKERPDIPGKIADGYGLCSGGGVGSPCISDDECKKGKTGKPAVCIDNSNGKDVKRCTDFEIDSPCDPGLAEEVVKEGGCWRDFDKPAKCIDVFLGTPGAASFLCKPAISGAIDSQTKCTTDSECGYTGKFGDWQCINNLCSKRDLGHNCYTDGSNPEPCQSGLTCGFSYVKEPNKLIKETGAFNSYAHNTDLLNAWQAAHGSTTICGKSENVIEPSQVTQ
ncbi:MAG: pilin, partial [Elusimicrobia bacterium]|nr:pilin [Elusimicrobiota bacterium]